jgi:spermidine dehydrogenase
MSWTDKELGMDRRITRRDFMNGAAMAIAAAATPGSFAQGTTEAQDRPGYDPPAAHGLRGSHVGAFEVAHRLRDGTFWNTAGQPERSGETYDLIVVGGGISGLSSARFFHQAAGKTARVLILENHDDFGGHAKRNEFHLDKNFMLGFGGTFSIESPAPYSPVAKSMIQDLGIDVSSYTTHLDTKPYNTLGLKKKYFFDKETFGADRLVVHPSGGADEKFWREFAAQAPLSDKAKEDLKRLYSLDDDLMPGLDSEQKKGKLARMSYADYLRNLVKVDPQVVTLLDPEQKSLYGVGIDAISAQDAWGLNMPGFDGLKLKPGAGPGMGRDAIPNEEAEKYFFHFPDGNATIARLIVRSLIPEAIPGKSADDVVTSQVRYEQLDQPANPTRIRLNSTVVRVRHEGDPSTAKGVEVTYVRDGRLYTVKGAHCILACWHQVIPLLTSELPAAQVEYLRSAEKVPLVYTNVALNNWESFVRLQTRSVSAPGSYFTDFALDRRVSIGDYQCTKRPDEPIVLTMERYPCSPGKPARQQHVAGRYDLYGTSFETFERKIRELLARSLGAGGFDPGRDIAAITVNRWPHGYAYQYNSLWDPFWLNGGPLPCVEARKPFGRIAIANADADAYAYTDCAINQAYRAVNDLKITAS